MREGWVVVFSADQEFKAKVAEDILKQHEIVSHMVQEPDSAFPMLGKAALYTPQESAEKAISILQKEGLLASEE